MEQLLRAKITGWWSEMLLMLNHPISYIKAWWYYYKRNRYMRRVARAMKRSCEEWGRLTGEMYLSGFVVNATKAFCELGQVPRTTGLTEEGAV